MSEAVDFQYRLEWQGLCSCRSACVRQKLQLEMDPAYGEHLNLTEFARVRLVCNPDKHLICSQAIVKTSSSGQILNAHVRPMFDLCGLGYFPYDKLVDLKNATELHDASLRMGFPVAFTKVSILSPVGALLFALGIIRAV